MAAYPYNTTQWQRLRRVCLAMHPLCERCLADRKQPVAASHVDHRKAISDGGDPFPPVEGLASLCASCHSQKTARGPEAGAVRSGRSLQPRKGCDEQGNPLDPLHPWSAAQ